MFFNESNQALLQGLKIIIGYNYGYRVAITPSSVKIVSSGTKKIRSCMLFCIHDRTQMYFIRLLFFCGPLSVQHG